MIANNTPFFFLVQRLLFEPAHLVSNPNTSTEETLYLLGRAGHQTGNLDRQTQATCSSSSPMSEGRRQVVRPHYRFCCAGPMHDHAAITDDQVHAYCWQPEFTLACRIAVTSKNGLAMSCQHRHHHGFLASFGS
ncbi:hypothetical protein HBH56_070690 [Parastagonospora nodorum]|nr:hypothetical protein HBH56_070690 [Parastagonospora nodorum]KAH3932769.1 hypothetical protein HBH54_077400 [Parastagonospora nodorum]KAH3954834.1 hypothetical protein HBH53_016940 [Parastagonospora nodorum]KAH3986151.1 hypothetical protein HBH52_048090 [Parastagonospora nodorum]KAH4004570.1 hypothetical protein HBI10_039470 [Parastagonospora nodorum]